MTFDEYQDAAQETAVYPDQYGVMYPALGLAGEAGEVANKVKKLYRDHGGRLSREDADSIASEIGDVLWYCAALCNDLGVNLDTVAAENLRKLSNRKAGGTISGSGDER